MHGDEHPMRTTTHPESIPPSPARAILYALSSKRDSPALALRSGKISDISPESTRNAVETPMEKLLSIIRMAGLADYWIRSNQK
jgi:hypothetical protein